MRKMFLPLFILPLVCCTQLHNVQFSDNYHQAGERVPFEVIVSEVGISTDEAAGIAQLMAHDQSTKDTIESIRLMLAMSQFGPKTGNPVADDTFADEVAGLILQKCPSGKITGLVSIRETNKPPVISGEVVRIKGYCLEGGK